MFAFRRLLLFILVFSLASAVFGQTQSAKPDTLGYPLLPKQAGDVCIVCGMELGAEGLAILYSGRRVPLYNGENLRIFLNDPDAYFSKLQARGALFDEKAMPAGAPIASGWLYFGMYILSGLFLGGLAAGVALRHRGNTFRALLIGFFFSLPGLIWVILQYKGDGIDLPDGLRKLRDTVDPSRCIGCGAELHPAAEECPGCGQKRQAEMESEVRRAALSNSTEGN